MNSPCNQSPEVQRFFDWHWLDLSEFVVCRLEEWAEGSQMALGLGWRAFAKLIGGLPGWGGSPVAMPSARDRC